MLRALADRIDCDDLMEDTENYALRTQVIEGQAEIERLDGEIAEAEAAMNDQLAALYVLIYDEWAIVEGRARTVAQVSA